MPPRPRRHAYSVAAVVALLGAAGILAFLIVGSGVAVPSAPGLVHSTEIKIAPEISGRLARFVVEPGQKVHTGDALVELSNPELSASLVLAKAQLDEAKAARDRVYAGIRQEQVATMAREIEVAKGDVTYAEQEYFRVSTLARDGFASHQQLDEATAAVNTAHAKLAEAEKIYEAAHTGPIKEVLGVADAKVDAAAAAVDAVPTWCRHGDDWYPIVGSILLKNLAGGLGFEPRLAESESAVLPLDDPPPAMGPRPPASPGALRL